MRTVPLTSLERCPRSGNGGNSEDEGAPRVEDLDATFPRVLVVRFGQA